MMDQYVITGIGLYNGLGSTTNESWNNLIAGKSAVRNISWPEDDSTQFPQTYSSFKVKIAAPSPRPDDHVYPEKFRHVWQAWDKNTRASMLTVEEALEDSKLKSKNLGVVSSTFGGGTTLRLEMFAALNSGSKRFSPKKVLNIGLDYPAAQISSIYNICGPNTAMNSACSTGLTSIDYAIMSLKTNKDLDGVIVNGFDHLVDPIYMYWFQCLGALSTGDTPDCNRPFDKNRNGFIMGEGAATLIIEPYSKAIKRNAKIYGYVRSTSFYTLCESDTSPDADGIGAKTVMANAISKAGLRPEQIEYINAHATSTPIGDDIEFNAAKELMPGIPIVSNKGQIGHGMAASGIVETIYTLLAMKYGRTPGNKNLVEPLGDGMILPSGPMYLDIKYAIKNSFGFGGRNASIVLERYDN